MLMSAAFAGLTTIVPLYVNGALPEGDGPPSIASVEPRSSPARVMLNL